MKVDVYLKQARRNVKRDSYPVPEGYCPHCVTEEEARRIARSLIREGYPPPFVFQTLQSLDMEPGHRIEVLAFARQSMMGRLDEGAIVNPNCEDASDVPSEPVSDPEEWR